MTQVQVRTEVVCNQQLVRLHRSQAALDRIIFSASSLRLPLNFRAEIAACKRVAGIYVTNASNVTARQVKAIASQMDLVGAEALISKRDLTDYAQRRPRTDNAYFLRFAVNASIAMAKAIRATGEERPIGFYYTHTQRTMRGTGCICGVLQSSAKALIPTGMSPRPAVLPRGS